MEIITVPFGHLLNFLYQLTGNYGISLILFAVLVQVVMLPITAKSKKSMMKMTRMQPKLNAIREKYPRAKIIAEDLGFITEDVRELLLETGFPGMKMLHFAFYDPDSENLPRMYESRNCVVYSASHDSDCSYTWQRNISGTARRRFNKECPRNKQQHRVYDLIEFAFRSKANLAMVPMQDYLLLSNKEGRMNEPATATGNWAWRLSSRYDTEKLRTQVLNITVRTKRNK